MKNLDELGQQLGHLDHLLIEVLARRMQVAREVESFKRGSNQPILRQDVEAKRLDQAAGWAQRAGLNPDFARSILYQAIAESCRVQVGQLQSPPVVEEWKSEADYHEGLKRNLITLTERWAPGYDLEYRDGYPATQHYIAFERRVIAEQVEQLNDRSVAVDLGCATGITAVWLAESFEQTIGYDLSPAMIAKAQEKGGGRRNVQFVTADVEEPIPLRDASVSLVIMNFGTASDVLNLQGVVREIERILAPGGRFCLSFYNAEALVYRWRMLPWNISLAAQINLEKHCLEVHCGDAILPIYARPYTVPEVEALFGGSLVLDRCQTYPTLASILPSDIFESVEVADSVTHLDNQLASSALGAYILADGYKRFI